MKFLLASRFFL